MIDTSTPVLVLCSSYHGGLAIVRSLGRLGVPVYVLDSNRSSLAFQSRYCRGGFHWDLENSSAEDSLDQLSTLGAKLGGQSVLIPTTDASARFVDDYSAVLKKYFRFAHRPEHLADRLSDKQSMFAFAKAFGIPTPETFFPESLQEVLAYSGSCRFPLIMKPIVTNRSSRRQVKTIVKSKEEMIRCYTRLETPGQRNIMIQEFIPGGDEATWMFNGYFDAGSRCLFGITGQKIRQFRPYAGITSLGVCVQNESFRAEVLSFMCRIGYSGPLDCGYRYDARDGAYKVFDINPRIGSTFRLFVTDNGMDVARATYLDLTGQAVVPGRPLDGRKWMVEDLDLASSFRYWRDGNLSLRSWLGSLKGIQEFAFFASDDLRPAASVWFNHISRIIERPGT